MTEPPEPCNEPPEDPDENAEDEMSADERALLDAYLLWLAKEGARDIERGDFIVARTREELRRILWDGWRPSSQEGEIEAAGPAGARRAHCPKETSASLLAA